MKTAYSLTTFRKKANNNKTAFKQNRYGMLFKKFKAPSINIIF